MNNRIPKVGLVKIKRRSGNYYRLRYRLPGDKNHTYENVGYTSKNRAELAQAQKQSDFINGKFKIPSQNAEVISLQRLVDEYYGNSKILKTTNGGNNWFEQQSPTLNVLTDVFFIDILNGCAVGSIGTIIHTTDGGMNWIRQYSGSIAYTLTSVHFIDTNDGWLVGENGRVCKTTNAGLTWESNLIGTSENLNCVYFDNISAGWILGEEGNIYHTTNGGASWTLQESNTTRTLRDICFLNGDIGWIVGDGGTVLHTTNGGVSFVQEEQTGKMPTEYLVSQNYPNPFNPSTKIKYTVPQTTQVQIKVYDILGKEIETLVNEEKPVGTYELTWNAANLPSGVYFYQLKAGEFVSTKKMVLMK